jgi:hypothetical protein
MTKKHLSIITVFLCIVLIGASSFAPNATYAQDGTATAEAETEKDCMSKTSHPVATRIAKQYGVSYAEIMNWHCQGRGFGEIMKAYALAKLTSTSANPLTVEQIFAMRAEGKGWGVILKELGYKMKDLKGKGNNGKGNHGNNGRGNKGDKHDKHDNEDNDEDND